MQASQPEKKKHQVLAVGCVLEMKGFVTREEDLGVIFERAIAEAAKEKEKEKVIRVRRG